MKDSDTERRNTDGKWNMKRCSTVLVTREMKIKTIMSNFAASLQSSPTLCDPMDCSPPGFSVHGILQARTLEGVAISFSNAWVESESEVAQSCLTLNDPMDCSLPGSSVHGISQARVLEWVAIAFSQWATTTYLLTIPNLFIPSVTYNIHHLELS